MQPSGGAPVIIAGGGIGGLATALACARHGLTSILCERRAVFSEDGAGIQIGPNGTRILEALGVAAKLRSAIAAPDAIAVMSLTSGKRLARLPLGNWIATRHSAPYWTAHRQDLHAALRETAEANPLIGIETGTEITSFAESGAAIEAIDARDRRIEGRTLVAADGLWSKLRHQITTAPDQIGAGKCAYRGIAVRARLPAGLEANDVHIWLGPGAHVVHYPVRGGREIAVVAILDNPAEEEGWNAPVPSGWIEQRASAFPQSLRDILNSVEAWRMWSLVTVPPLESWTRGRAALLGDAAHPVLPFLAQGAVMALEDATTIADHLARSHGDDAEALRTYEAARKQRTSRVASASRDNGRIYHMSGIIAAARDTVLRATPGALLLSRYDWLYGWTGPDLDNGIQLK